MYLNIYFLFNDPSIFPASANHTTTHVSAQARNLGMNIYSFLFITIPFSKWTTYYLVHTIVFSNLNGKVLSHIFCYFIGPSFHYFLGCGHLIFDILLSPQHGCQEFLKLQNSTVNSIKKESKQNKTKHLLNRKMPQIQSPLFNHFKLDHVPTYEVILCSMMGSNNWFKLNWSALKDGINRSLIMVFQCSFI